MQKPYRLLSSHNFLNSETVAFARKRVWSKYEANSFAVKTFSDFIDRMAGQDMNKRALEGLISCGAFDSMGVKRSQLLAVYEKALDGTARAARDNVAGQMSLFDTIEEQSEMQFPNIDELDKKTMLKMEKQSTGLYFSGHPMEEYTDKIKKLTKYNISDVLTSVHKDEDGNYHQPIHLQTNHITAYVLQIQEYR